MVLMIPGKLLGMAILLLLMTALAVACGGGSKEFNTLPPESTQAFQPTQTNEVQATQTNEVQATQTAADHKG